MLITYKTTVCMERDAQLQESLVWDCQHRNGEEDLCSLRLLQNFRYVMFVI